MLNKTSLTILIVITTVVWGAGLWILGVELSWDHVKPYSSTVFIITLLVGLFDKYLWRWRLIAPWVNRPDIEGTWRVELMSTYQDPEGKPAGTVHGYASIKQRYSSLSLRLMTEKSSSHLIAYSFRNPDDQVVELLGLYQSDPDIHLRRSEESAIHYGSFKVRMSGAGVQEIKGHYWTDRNTTGSITYSDKRPKFSESLAAAKSLYAADTRPATEPEA